MKYALVIAGLAGGLVAATEKATQRAEPDFSKVELKATHLSESVWMVEGMGGNIGVCAGDDGVFVIDDQFAPLAPKVKAAISGISPKPVRFLFNTHWHGDHTGGNLAMGEAGAVIVAHDNVRQRLSTDQVIAAFGGRRVPASPTKALPVVTFKDGVSFHLNGDDIEVIHLPAAHTDGDSAVHFVKADVIHTGDTLVNGGYPIFDYSSGGTIDGYLRAQEKVLSIAGPKTKIIPGHGALTDKAGLQLAHDTLQKLRDRIVGLVDQGKTLAEVQAAKPTAEVESKWGTGMVKGDLFVDMAYNSYLAEKKLKP